MGVSHWKNAVSPTDNWYFKQGSGHLQSYFLLLQQRKGRRESHLVFQDYALCCTIPADN